MNKNVLKFVLSLKIRRLRQKKGLSLKDLAERSGLSHSYLNEIEKGKKYPKVEKLLGLAQALDISIEELVSAKMGRKLHPLLEFLESDLATSIPFSAFGIAEQDVYDLMSHSPEKFTSFLMTVSEIAKSYDINLNDLNKAALRAYLEVNNNYFPYLEELATVFGNSLYKNLKGKSDEEWINSLIQRLQNECGLRVDRDALGSQEGTAEIRTLLKPGKKGKSPVLYLNQNLDSKQVIHALVKELGSQQVLSQDSTTERNPLKKDFSGLLFDSQSFYFAGAALIPEDEIIEDLKSIFEKGEFTANDFLVLMDKYSAPQEVFMGRLTQIIPHHFGLNQMFFLCCNENIKRAPDSYFISQELHLGQLHHPHGVSLQEHYCRRWVTTELLKDLKKSDLSFKFSTQISKMEEGGRPYLCLSLARTRGSELELNSCFTLGLAIDESFKGQVSNLENANIEEKVVGRTCERCSIDDCKERVAPPTIWLREQRYNQKIAAIELLLE